MPPTIHVSLDQIDAARTLIRLRGANSAVDPVIVRIAHAEEPHPAKKDPATAPPRAATVRVSSDQVSAARALIRLRGGEQHVDEVICRIAHATQPDSAPPSTS